MVRSTGDDDAELARRLAAGDEQAVERLLSRHGPRVAGHLRKRFLTFREEEIHDCLVDAALAVTGSYEPSKGPLGPWFLLLAHRRAIDLLRKGVRERSEPGLPAEDEVADPQPTPAARSEQRDQVEHVRAALRQLAPMERAVIEADLEAGGTAVADLLAAQLGTTPRAVYAARQRAREKLRKILRSFWHD